MSEEFRSWNIEEYLPNIHVPVLVIQGLEDQYGTWKQIEAIESGCAGRVESVAMEHCGHSPHKEHAELTLSLVTKLIAS